MNESWLSTNGDLNYDYCNEMRTDGCWIALLSGKPIRPESIPRAIQRTFRRNSPKYWRKKPHGIFLKSQRLLSLNLIHKSIYINRSIIMCRESAISPALLCVFVTSLISNTLASRSSVASYNPLIQWPPTFRLFQTKPKFLQNFTVRNDKNYDWHWSNALIWKQRAGSDLHPSYEFTFFRKSLKKLGKLESILSGFGWNFWIFIHFTTTSHWALYVERIFYLTNEFSIYDSFERTLSE